MESILIRQGSSTSPPGQPHAPPLPPKPARRPHPLCLCPGYANIPQAEPVIITFLNDTPWVLSYLLYLFHDTKRIFCATIYTKKLLFLPTGREYEMKKLLTNKYDDIVFVGDGAVLHEDMIREKMVGKKIVFSSNNKQNAESLGIIAYKKIKNGEFTDPDSVVPVYLRKSQAERLKDAKENS